jgi:hypothetical protein
LVATGTNDRDRAAVGTNKAGDRADVDADETEELGDSRIASLGIENNRPSPNITDKLVAYLLNLVAALDGTGVALAVGGRNRGDEGGEGNEEGRTREHLCERRPVSLVLLSEVGLR